MNILSRSILGFFVLFVGFFAISPHISFASKAPKAEIIQKYILDAYKLQGDKNIAILAKKMEKMENVDKITTYKNLQTSYILRKQSIMKNKKFSQMTKNILSKYIDYIVSRLEGERQKLLK